MSVYDDSCPLSRFVGDGSVLLAEPIVVDFLLWDGTIGAGVGLVVGVLRRGLALAAPAPGGPRRPAVALAA